MVDCAEILRSAFGSEPVFEPDFGRWVYQHRDWWAACFTNHKSGWLPAVFLVVIFKSARIVSGPINSINEVLPKLRSYITQLERAAIEKLELALDVA